MLQIRTIVNNQPIFLDLYRNEPVLLSLSFAEIQDITKKNSNFSKAFSLPGSKNNNQTFNFFYDLNSIPTTFNPNDKFECELLWDGYEIMRGYIRLNSVSISNGEIIYSVTFYNQIGDLMANIGDKFLYDLNLDHLSHPYSEQVILQSNLNPNLFSLTGNTNYAYQNGKTMWGLFNIGYEYLNEQVFTSVTPLVQFSPITGSTYDIIPGNFDFSGTPVRDFYYKPAIQVKELYESIFRDAGYNVESDFFETSYFKNFYLPLKFGDETIYSKNGIPPCYTVSAATIIPDSGFDIINQSTGVTCNSLGLSAQTTFPFSLTIPAKFSGLYTFRFTFSVNTVIDCPSANINLNFFVEDQVGFTNIYKNVFCNTGETTTVSFTRQFLFTGNSDFFFYFINTPDIEVINYKQEIIDGPRYIPNGDIVNYALEFPDNDYKQIDFITSINKYFNLVVVPNPDNPSNLIIEPIVDYVGTGEVLDWTTKVDFSKTQNLYPTTSLLNGTLEYDFKLDQDYTNQDFEKQANRVFGSDKFVLNQQYKDNTTKFEFVFSSPIELTVNNAYVPMITIPSMSKVKQVDSAGVTQQTFTPFKILPKLIYRGATIPNDSYGYFGNTGNTSSVSCVNSVTINITSPGYIQYYTCSNEQIVAYYFAGTTTLTNTNCISAPSVSGMDYEPATFTIVSSGSLCDPEDAISDFQYYYMNDNQMDRWTNINRFTTYPFNYNNFSHYTNFRGEDKTDVKPAEFSFVADDLYNVYYEDYIQDILSEENKIFSCKIYLYPQDIQKLKWNERILINNTYFRINKITNFNALEPSICDVELVKLTKTYNPHPVLYYKFDLCSTTTDLTLYSNSDLMFHAYAYAGNKVKLYDDGLNYLGCFTVSITDYSPFHDYQHYYFGSAYTSNLVGVYADCGCSIRTQFNLVQETPNITIPFNYVGFVCNNPSLSYVFTTTASTLNPSVVYKISNTGTTSETLTACVTNVTPTFIQQTDWILTETFDNCEECVVVPLTPTPTPSSTPPTPTPTITPTPSYTPLICVCNEYTITNTSENIQATACWNDCSSGNQVCNFILPGQFITICACENSVSIVNGSANINFDGPC